jgi:predicted transcriptional regulator
MNDTQKRILAYVRRYQKRKGVSPTQREIAAYAGRSVSTVNEALAGLEKLGKISRQTIRSANTGKGRTIELPGSDANSRTVNL